MPSDVLGTPVDAEAAAALAAQGLRMALVDPADDAAVRAWVTADARGFHDGEPTDELFAVLRGDFALQRSIGIHDDALPEPAVPVATVTSWPAALTLPGGQVTGWAISGVTVAPTHHRRGIARAMLEAELRVAAAAGLPVAMLTVSEATLYGRYGFAPAAWRTAIAVDARRARPIAGAVPGRVELVGRDLALTGARELFEEARRATPGDVAIVGHRFDRLFGSPAEPDELRRRRFARYVDVAGIVRGLVAYSLQEDAADFTRHTAVVHTLVAVDDDAYRALWAFLVELDLVGTVTADLRSTDEPLRWLVRDQRAIRTTDVSDHLWVRVLDPVAAFAARTYAGAGVLGLRIADPLGHAEGDIVVRAAADGRATVSAGQAPADAPLLDVPIDVLGSLLLGGVSAGVLARAGRLAERTPGAATAADRLLRAPTTPVLTTWF